MDPNDGTELLKANPYRLPRNVLPRKYFLSLTPNLKICAFSGTIQIILDVENPTSEIVMHALDLEIPEYELWNNGLRVPIEKMSFNKNLEMVTFSLKENASA